MDACVYGFEFLLEETELSPRKVWESYPLSALHEVTLGKKKYRIAISFDSDSEEFVGMVCVARKRSHESRFDPSEGVYEINFENTSLNHEFNFFRVASTFNRGCYTHYAGGVSLRNFCRIIRGNLYQQAVDLARDEETQRLIRDGQSKTKAEKSSRKKFPGTKAIVVGPLVRERQLTNLLEELESFEYFAFKLPEFEDDPFSNARPELRSVQTTLRFQQQNQVKRNVLGIIREQIHRFGLDAGSVRGKKGGQPKSIRLNQKTFSLATISMKELLPSRMKPNEMLEFRIFERLREEFRANSDMFEVT